VSINMLRVQFPVSTGGFQHSGSYHSGDTRPPSVQVPRRYGKWSNIIQGDIVSRTQESRTSTRHCRYSVPTKTRFTSLKTKTKQQ
jgi:hypothetical protein